MKIHVVLQRLWTYIGNVLITLTYVFFIIHIAKNNFLIRGQLLWCTTVFYCRNFHYLYSSFSKIHNFLPNPGRILPALTLNGLRPLSVNAGRILIGFGRKLWIIEKLDYFLCQLSCIKEELKWVQQVVVFFLP